MHRTPYYTLRALYSIAPHTYMASVMLMAPPVAINHPINHMLRMCQMRSSTCGVAIYMGSQGSVHHFLTVVIDYPGAPFITVRLQANYWFITDTRDPARGSLQCHIRGYTGSQAVLQQSLGSSMGSYKGLQYHVRGLAGSQNAVQCCLEGPIQCAIENPVPVPANPATFF